MEYKIELTQKEYDYAKNFIAGALSGKTVSTYSALNEATQARANNEIDRYLVLKNIEDRKIAVPLVKRPRSNAHDLLAWKTYGERYANICCDRRKAIDDLEASLTPEELYKATKDVVIKKDTYVIEIKE
jgi:hypothetical protein